MKFISSPCNQKGTTGVEVFWSCPWDEFSLPDNGGKLYSVFLADVDGRGFGLAAFLFY